MVLAGSAATLGGGLPIGSLIGATRTSRRAEVIVIGAGMAGVAAANSLRRHGVETIVLEARDRMGGRIWSSREMKGAALDMGACWIHGAEGSPLTPLARRLGVRTIWTPFTNIAVRGVNGNALNAAQETEVLARFGEHAVGLAEFALERFSAGLPDISVAKAVSLYLDRQSLPTAQRTEVQYFFDVFFGELRSALPSDLSLYYTETDKNLGVEDRAFPDGYVQLVRALAQGLDIRYQHLVQEIDHGGGGVRIQTNNGVFEGERCVVTLPLGVLRTNRIRFSPRLPASKRGAIDRLHMGTDNKVFLRFPKMFWERKATFMLRQQAEAGKWGVWVNAHTWTGQPIFQALIGGDYAIRMEDFSKERIISEAMSALRSIYGRNIPDPEAMTHSRWHSDPFCLGAYSHIPPGATPNDYAIMGRPVGKRLFFAGEATISAYRSSVRGAYVTGRREAARILQARRSR